MQKWLNKNLIENTYVFAILSVFLAMYGPRLHMALPRSIRSLFSNPLFRGLILFLVVYLSNHDMVMALTITIIFVVVMYGVQMSNLLEGMYVENFEVYGKPVANCSNYEQDSSAQPVYPSS
jgi:hypothetical protein